MSGDPTEYRAHATRCAELAAEAKEPRLKQTLTNIAASWVKLACELERAHTLRDELAKNEIAGAFRPARAPVLHMT